MKERIVLSLELTDDYGREAWCSMIVPGDANHIPPDSWLEQAIVELDVKCQAKLAEQSQPCCRRCGERIRDVAMLNATLCGLCADDEANGR